MAQDTLDFEDLRETGSFHRQGGTFLIRVKSRSQPNHTAILFQAILNEDNDGAPNCYAPPGLGALDNLADGTNDENAQFDPNGRNTWKWVGVLGMTVGEFQAAQNNGLQNGLDQRLPVRDRNQQFPVFNDASQQHYVSTTAALTDSSKPDWDQNKYFNAATVSYGALSQPLMDYGVGLGDYGLAIRIDTGVFEPFLYADIGPGGRVGEMSRQLFRRLFPGNNQENHPVAFLVFPRSADSLGRNAFRNNPTPTLRNHLSVFSRADNADELLSVMATGQSYFLWKPYAPYSDELAGPPGNLQIPYARPQVSLTTAAVQGIERALGHFGFQMATTTPSTS